MKLSAVGHEQTQLLTVRKDPNTAGTEADTAAQTQMLVDLRRDLNTAIDVLNRSELVRSQVEWLGRVVDDASVRKAADDLNKGFIDLEMTLIDLRITGGQDGVRYAAKLISHFGYLANGLSNADFRPTNQQAEVQELLAGRVRDTVTRFDALVAKDLGAFNDLLRRRNIPHVVAK